jgi:hypothetical protein
MSVVDHWTHAHLDTCQQLRGGLIDEDETRIILDV